MDNGGPGAAVGVAPVPGALQTRTPVTVIVPCYNEAPTVPHLARTLRSVETVLAPSYDLRFVFVDDGSVDGTWDALHTHFGTRPQHTLVRHPSNRGITAAILTGVRHTDTEIVCSIDCDCTYDPHELKTMIPILQDGVDVVTASPYHPRGRVEGVPAWRLWLSRGAALLYRQILRQKLFTYTSCFRVYRRSAIASLETREQGFVGIAEMLSRLDLQGRRIVEYPTTLGARVLGQSKLNAPRSILGHLRLMGHLLRLRLLRTDALGPDGGAR